LRPNILAWGLRLEACGYTYRWRQPLRVA